MKILIVSSLSAFPYAGGGGSWSYVNNLQNELESKGHLVEILSPQPGHDRYHLIRQGVSIDKHHIMPLLRSRIHKAFEIYENSEEAWIQAQEIDKYSIECAAAYFGLDFDIIHAQDVIAARAMKRVKKKDTALILTIHGCLTADHIRGGVIQPGTKAWHYTMKTDYLGVVSSNKVICPSHWLKDEMIHHTHAPHDKMEIIPNGIQSHHFAQRMNESPSAAKPAGKHVLISVARLIPEKDFNTLLQGLSNLLSIRTDWECWIVGDGPTRTNVEQMCEQLGLADHVKLLGSRFDVPALMSQADIFLLSSNYENCPYAVLEAQMAKLPVIVTNAGGLPEIVEEGHTGFLVPQGDSSAISDRVNLLLNHAELKHELGVNGQRRVSSVHSMDSIMARTLQLYEQVKC